ncbi:MAG TPA: GYD domain-containing protein [Actinomycetota bacterium]|nr:GYD domain-containing protein [Actinomycetota bacterium]
MKYMWQVSYTPEGMKGLIKEGGSSRRTMVDKMVQNMGGRIESFHFAFGDKDAYIIGEMPNNADVAAIGMAVGAAGAASVKTTVLMTPEEIDLASEKVVDYRPPGA